MVRIPVKTRQPHTSPCEVAKPAYITRPMSLQEGEDTFDVELQIDEGSMVHILVDEFGQAVAGGYNQKFLEDYAHDANFRILSVH